MKISDYVVRFFEKQKVNDLFMVTGGSSMHLIDSFGRSKKIKYWCTEHEQSAAMAAEAYAKMRNDFGLVLITGGPAATNTLTGVLDCWQDSIPVVFISGQSKRKQTIINSGIEGLRQFGVQEVNIIPIVESITNYAVEIDDIKKIRYYLEKAVYMAKNGRPGPVWLSIPLDVQSADVDINDLKGFEPEEVDTVKTSPTNEELEYISQKLLNAKRPVVIAGHGIRLSGACDEFSEFLLKHNIPAVTPVMGIDVLEGGHPCNIGRTGIKGTRAGNFAMQNADLIISIGSRLAVSVIGHEFEKFAREADVVVVDIDTIEHQKNTIGNIERIINCDAKSFIELLDNFLQDNYGRKEWLGICQNWKKKYPVVLPEYDDDSCGINYYRLIDIINKTLREDTPVVADAGSAFYVVNQTIDLKKGQRYITTGGTATMGFAVPAAIGMAVADPNDEIIVVTGEGSFMQNLQEMEVIQYHNFNIKIFVANNNGYFSVHNTQERFFDGNYVGAGIESGISFTSIEKLAQAFDIKYYQYSRIKDLENGIADVMALDGPVLVEVIVTEKMEVIPTVSSQIMPNGVMVSKPLEDMYPFLDRDEFQNQMIIKPEQF